MCRVIIDDALVFLNLRRGCTLCAGASGAVRCMDVSCEKLQGVSSCIIIGSAHRIEVIRAPELILQTRDIVASPWLCFADHRCLLEIPVQFMYIHNVLYNINCFLEPISFGGKGWKSQGSLKVSYDFHPHRK